MRSRKKTEQKKHTFRNFFIILIILSIIAGVAFGIQVQKNGGGIKGFLLTAMGANAQKVENLKTIYVLALGVSTDLDNKLTDTIMLCGYNPKTNQAMMLSIPRDTFIGTNKNKAKGNDKINSLYSHGPEKTVEAVEELIGINIDYYAVINNELLIQLVDVLGGVEFDVPIDMNYDDPTQDLHIHLKKGMQIIDGEKAEQLLRFRHSNPDKNGKMTTYPAEYGADDYGRMRTQREFIKAVASKVIQPENIFKVKKIINTVMDNLETNIRKEEIVPYIPYVTDLDINNIRMEQLPGESDFCNKVWVYIHDKTETEILVESIVNTLENGIIEN